MLNVVLDIHKLLLIAVRFKIVLISLNMYAFVIL